MQTNAAVSATLERLAARATGRADGSGALVGEFIRRAFADSAPDDIAERPDDDVYGAIVQHWELGRVRAPGQTLVRVLSPDRAEHGWGSSHSVLLLVTDDAPFLVDSVRMALERLGVRIHLMIHPMLRVTRDLRGEIVELPERGGTHEAWTMMEIDRSSPAAAAAVSAEVSRAVADVHLAVADVDAMRSVAVDLAKQLDADPPAAVEPDEVTAVQRFVLWVARRHFVFLGTATYDCIEGSWVVRDGTRLGLLRRDAPLDPAPAAHRHLLSISRSECRSTVHRDARFTCIAVRSFDDTGAVVAEHRLVGLFSAAAYRESALAIPYVRDRVEAVLAESPVAPESHIGRSMRSVLETFPRDELFEISVEQLSEIVHGIVALQERQIVRVFAVGEPVGAWVTVLVYLPRSRFTAQTAALAGEKVGAAFGSGAYDVDATVGTSALARITVRVRRGSGAVVDLDDLAGQIDVATTPWTDRLRSELIAGLGERHGLELLERTSVPEAYRAVVEPTAAVTDLRRADELVRTAGELATALVPGSGVGEWRFLIYRRGGQATLAELLPLLDELGLRALDERAFQLHASGEAVWLYDIGVRLPEGATLDEVTIDELRATFADLYASRTEVDGFNQLVLRARLGRRQVDVMRAYGKYLRQLGVAFSQQYIESTLVAHGSIVRSIAELFDVRFDPRFAGDRAERGAELDEGIIAALDNVPSLDDDRILRSFHALVRATTRTNAFRPPDDAADTATTGTSTTETTRSGSLHRPVLAFKLDLTKVPDVPQPRPMFEIWVSSSRVEGVHLRGGRIARGGIRWSDRREDFRTEVLGLMKAQMVKNAVIVPVGAKGGFVVKRPPADVEAMRSEVVSCYRDFIGGLLDLTDNIEAGHVVPPPLTVRYDADDPYLVVAADKGTASFSDIANEISTQRGFWLGDAFASGGSTGYDHKAMAITARGAWESVRRHAGTLGLDADHAELVVAGIGDMSGDVFGNGMLLSSHLRLVAAFDHRHVFLDPDPDPQVSFAERQRLFELPRSSWADYDARLISAGGGVYPRTAKSIVISPQVARRLGIDAEVLTPNELISAILRAPVDLLWNGGIGTYVKASSESHADVGDRSNDAVRVDAASLRCRMVAEGGNLGFSQRGRIEYALGGGLINTDAIDNSAGVDCSDHEVNIKIALGAAVAAGELTWVERNSLLAAMTDEVAAQVLADNEAQTLVLDVARRQARPMANVHARYLAALETEGVLNRSVEFLPTDKQLAEREAAGTGLTAPEFAVLMAYTKTANIAELLGTDLPDDPDLAIELLEYFPELVRQRFGAHIRSHRLRREIVATQVVNKMVNVSGISFDHRMTEETGAALVDVVRAWLAARDIFATDQLWRSVDRLHPAPGPDVRSELLLDVRRMHERGTLWLLRHRRPPLAVGDTAAQFRDGVQVLLASLHDVLGGPMKNVVEATERARKAAGVPAELAAQSSIWPLAHTAFDVVEVSAQRSRDVLDGARIYWELFEALDVAWLWEGIGMLPRADRWQTQARSALRDDLLVALADLTADVIDSGADVPAWLRVNERTVARLLAMFAQIRRAQVLDLTTLSVGLRQLRNLALTAQRVS